MLSHTCAVRMEQQLYTHPPNTREVMMADPERVPTYHLMSWCLRQLT